MSIDNLVGLLVSVGLALYLVAALVHSEDVQ